MLIHETGFDGLLELTPREFRDPRGSFFEAFNQTLFQQLNLPYRFVQDNQSHSVKGVLRGMHLQIQPFEQVKLVRVVHGRVVDIALDLRPGSRTFGRYYRTILEGSRHNMLLIPAGFAHGFCALEETVFFYKCSNFYHAESERGIIWNDPDLSIDWGLADPLISEKDKKLPSLKEYCQSMGIG